MKKIIRLIILALVFSLSLTLTACGGDGEYEDEFDDAVEEEENKGN